jgi:hypothetical protein
VFTVRSHLRRIYGKTGVNRQAALVRLVLRAGWPVVALVQVSAVQSGDAVAALLYGQFGESWRIAQAESLFDYRNRETTDSLTDRTFPHRLATATSLPPDTRQQAEAACAPAGVTDPILLEGCIVDVGFTSDASLAAGAANAPIPERARS